MNAPADVCCYVWYQWLYNITRVQWERKLKGEREERERERGERERERGREREREKDKLRQIFYIPLHTLPHMNKHQQGMKGKEIEKE